MYEDRLEFTSIGGLVTGVTLEDVMMGISVCRNKRLANVFYRLELIEAYGTGIQKIMNAYQDQFIKPEIKVSNNVFKIILPNTNAQAELREELQYHTHIQPEDEETQIMQMIDQEKRIQRTYERQVLELERRRIAQETSRLFLDTWKPQPVLQENCAQKLKSGIGSK